MITAMLEYPIVLLPIPISALVGVTEHSIPFIYYHVLLLLVGYKVRVVWL